MTKSVKAGLALDGASSLLFLFGPLVPFFVTAIPQNSGIRHQGCCGPESRTVGGHTVGPDPTYSVNPYEFLAFSQPKLTRKAVDL